MSVIARIATISLIGLLHTSSHAWLFGIDEIIAGMSNKAKGIDGQHCIAASAKVGDRVPLVPGQVGLVQAVYGPNYQCPDSDYPIRAKLDVQLTEDARVALHSACVPRGSKVGDEIKVIGLGPVVIKSIKPTVTECGADFRNPLDATVQSTQAARP